MKRPEQLAELYRANAREAQARSDASQLDHVRLLHANAATAWLVLAVRAEQPRTRPPPNLVRMAPA